jgi:O2-independent ubiquinone biosynthesis accessory factor UbiT
MSDRALPLLPRPLALGSRMLRLSPLSLALSALARHLLARHPGILARMGPQAGKRFLLEFTDAPLVLLMEPARRRISAHRQAAAASHDAHLKGRVAAYLAMLHGRVDGDALFFEGALQVTGDTEAVLALRNALDDAEIDLAGEIARLAPPLRPMLGLAERLSGVALSRAPATGWTDGRA